MGKGDREMEKYEELELEIIVFADKDVITSSIELPPVNAEDEY